MIVARGTESEVKADPAGGRDPTEPNSLSKASAGDLLMLLAVNK
jgi:hypothetical protein